MRRSAREVSEMESIAAVLEAADVCRIGLYADDEVYIVPLSFGYELGGDGSLTLYFHCADEGRKLDMMALNPEVCFEMDTGHDFVPGENEACESTMKYASIIGWGRIEALTEKDEKIPALIAIMKHYSKEESYRFNEELLERTTVLRLTARSFTIKANP